MKNNSNKKEDGFSSISESKRNKEVVSRRHILQIISALGLLYIANKFIQHQKETTERNFSKKPYLNIRTVEFSHIENIKKKLIDFGQMFQQELQPIGFTLNKWLEAVDFAIILMNRMRTNYLVLEEEKFLQPSEKDKLQQDYYEIASALDAILLVEERFNPPGGEVKRTELLNIMQQYKNNHFGIKLGSLDPLIGEEIYNIPALWTDSNFYDFGPNRKAAVIEISPVISLLEADHRFSNGDHPLGLENMIKERLRHYRKTLGSDSVTQNKYEPELTQDGTKVLKEVEVDLVNTVIEGYVKNKLRELGLEYVTHLISQNDVADMLQVAGVFFRENFHNLYFSTQEGQIDVSVDVTNPLLALDDQNLLLHVIVHELMHAVDYLIDFIPYPVTIQKFRIIMQRLLNQISNFSLEELLTPTSDLKSGEIDYPKNLDDRRKDLYRTIMILDKSSLSFQSLGNWFFGVIGSQYNKSETPPYQTLMSAATIFNYKLSVLLGIELKADEFLHKALLFRHFENLIFVLGNYDNFVDYWDHAKSLINWSDLSRFELLVFTHVENYKHSFGNQTMSIGFPAKDVDGNITAASWSNYLKYGVFMVAMIDLCKTKPFEIIKAFPEESQSKVQHALTLLLKWEELARKKSSDEQWAEVAAHAILGDYKEKPSDFSQDYWNLIADFVATVMDELRKHNLADLSSESMNLI